MKALSANKAVMRVARRATPRMTTWNERGTTASRSAATKGIRIMRVMVDMALSRQGEPEEECRAQHQKKRIHLEAAGLHEPQCPPDNFGCAMRASHRQPGNEPAFYPLGDRGEHFMEPDNRGLVNFIEIKTLLHRAGKRTEFLGKPIFGSQRIDELRCQKTEQHGQQAERSGERRMSEW